MSTHADWAIAGLIAALPLAFVIAPLLSEIGARLRRRRAGGAALRHKMGG